MLYSLGGSNPVASYFLFGDKVAVAYLWKLDSNEYRFQINKISAKEKRNILQFFKSWNEAGSGYHKDGTETFIFSKLLNDDESIYRFAKQLPFPVVEERRNGETRQIKTQFVAPKKSKGLTTPKKSAKIGGGRTCSRCGNKGHNSRTCKA